MVETKVKASAAAAAVSGIALWLIGRYAFRGTAVPDVLQSWIYTLAPAVVTFGAGYLAKHTSRPAAPPPVPPPDVAVTRPEKTLRPPARTRGTDISPLADPPMEDLPAPVIPPAAPE